MIAATYRAIAGAFATPPLAPVVKESEARKLATAAAAAYGSRGIDPPQNKADYLGLYESVAVVHRCSWLNASAVAQGRLTLAQEDPRGDRIELDLPELLRAPNPAMDGQELIASTQLALELTGDAYWELTRRAGPLRRASDTPEEAWWLRPSRVEVVPAADGRGVGRYLFTVDGKARGFDPWQIAHFRAFNPNSDWYGVTHWASASEEINSDQRLRKQLNTMLANGARPSGIMTLSEDGDADEAAESFARHVAGVENTGKVLFLMHGETFIPLTITPAELEALESRRYSKAVLMQVAGVYPVIYGIEPGDTSATRENATVQERLYAERTIEPRQKSLAKQIQRRILPALGIEADVEFDNTQTPFYRRLRAEEATALAGLVGGPVLTADEVRAQFGKDPIEGGAELRKPSTPAGMAFGLPAAQRRGLVTRAADDFDLLRILFGPDDPELEKMAEAVEGIVERNGLAALAELGIVIDFDPATESLARWIHEKVSTFADVALNAYMPAVKEAINSTLADGGNLQAAARAIREIFDGRKDNALTVARTEALAAANRGRVQAFEDAGIKEHRWFTSQDDAVRDSHRALDGEVREIGEPFSNGLRWPGDGRGDPAEFINCRCDVVAIVPGVERSAAELGEQWKAFDEGLTSDEAKIAAVFVQLVDEQQRRALEELAR